MANTITKMNDLSMISEESANNEMEATMSTANDHTYNVPDSDHLNRPGATTTRPALEFNPGPLASSDIRDDDVM